MGGGESLFIMFGNRGNDDDACVGLPAFYKIRLWGEQWLMGNVVLCMRTTVWQGVEVCVTMVTQCVCAKAGGAGDYCWGSKVRLFICVSGDGLTEIGRAHV